MLHLVLVSHVLCPFVQRAVISLSEKGVPFERRDIDLAAKPDWFLAISPTGKVPVLLVDGEPIFESAVILEYLEDTIGPALHPTDPLARAEHRSFMEFGSRSSTTSRGSIPQRMRPPSRRSALSSPASSLASRSASPRGPSSRATPSLSSTRSMRRSSVTSM